MRKVWLGIIDQTQNKRVRQTFSLYSSMILGVLLSIAISVVNTRFLGAKHYGDFKFLQNLFSFFLVFFPFGFFVSGSRVLAKNKNNEKDSELYGVILIIAGIAALSFFVFNFMFSFFQDIWFKNDFGLTIRIISPLLFFLPFQPCIENILQGSNKIYELSIFRIGPKILYLILAVIFNYIIIFNLNVALFLHFFTIIIFIMVIIYFLKPKFSSISENYRSFLDENKKYGFPVYVGSLANVATAKIAGLSIAFFIDNTNVGYYALALAVTMPLKMLPTVVGVTYFKEFASLNRIPKMPTIVTSIFAIFSFIIFTIFIEDVITFLYTDEFLPIVGLVYIISLGSIIRGMGDYFNRFLGAHGRGKEIRNAAFANGLFNVFGFTVLVYFWGVQGAAVTNLVSDVLYFSVMVFYYKKYCNARDISSYS